jgi:uncharacterized protein (DUF1778 family)
METSGAHERTILKPVDHRAFFTALDDPPAPKETLRDAFVRHRETISCK